MAKIKLTDSQAGILVHLKNLNDEGLDAYGNPMGATGLFLAGAGAGGVGLIRRGLMERRGSLFYITEKGIETIAAWCDETPPMTVYSPISVEEAFDENHQINPGFHVSGA